MRISSYTGIIFFIVSLLFFSCRFWEDRVAVLWTDRPEFIFYAEQFNASQDRFKVEVYYYESVAQKLAEGRESPDIAAASWLQSASTRALFRSLDNVFSNDASVWASFYPRLLDLGKIDGKQHLLPVSFNIPAMVFASEHSQLMSNPFTISMEEIMERGREFNIEAEGVYTRMGFSPSWNDEFLFIAATLFNTSFQESSPISWDALSLNQSVLWIQEWTSLANSSVQAEDDFVFKYCYDPPSRLISSGRILFTCMDSSELFILAEDRRALLDFRWIAENDSIPVNEALVYFGIHNRARARNAALAFTRWFFRSDTQGLLLEISNEKRILETSFGIGDGFSAMRTVTEQIFPLFYPSLLGRMPPESFLSPPAVFPRDWMVLKDRVILPYLRDRVRNPDREGIRPLEWRITDWYRLNRS